MDEEYDVLSMDENTVTYSYYNYENSDVPQQGQNTVSFDELIRIEQGERVYLFYLYLEADTEKIERDTTEDFIEQIENNPDFMMKLGKVINSYFQKNL